MSARVSALLRTLIAVASIHFAVAAPVAAAGAGVNYLYELSNFTGPIPSNWVKVHVSPGLREIYVYDRAERSTRIFNESGMEVYEVLFDEDLGIVLDAVPDRDGNLFLLMQEPSRKTPYLARCDYRGEFRSRVDITGLPDELAGNFLPAEMFHREGLFYLVDRASMVVAVIDPGGVCKEVYDLGRLLGVTGKAIADSAIGGVSVDREGNLYFTIPTNFQAYKVSPDRKVSSFGQKGSAPGKFNIVGGIVSDERGYCYVADILRSVVMVFDKEFRFLFEFGYEGNAPGNLTLPKDLAVGPAGMVFVTQAGDRGVSVFRVTLN